MYVVASRRLERVMPLHIGTVASGDGKQPGPPTSVSATAGNTTASVSFTAPVYKGKFGIIGDYTATSSPGGITGTGTGPVSVAGLTNGTSYTFTVVANAYYGSVGVSSVASAASNSVTPTGSTSGKTCTSGDVALGCCKSTGVCAPTGVGSGATCSPVAPEGSGWDYNC